MLSCREAAGRGTAKKRRRRGVVCERGERREEKMIGGPCLSAGENGKAVAASWAGPAVQVDGLVRPARA